MLVLPMALGLSACDSLFEITNPGPMTDDSLNAPAAFAGLVAGMSGDLSQAIDNVGYVSATMSGELRSTGFLASLIAIAEGTMVPSDANAYWNNAHRARWVAEDGIRRMEAAGNNSILLARAYLLAGFSNRLLGEHFCSAVIDGGEAQPYTAHFTRAEQQFETARQKAAALNNAQIRNAATAGRASALAALGNWNEAAQLAAAVPINFQYNAVFSLNSARETSNFLINYPLEHSEGTVFGTEWAVSGDPRVPWEVALDPGGKPRFGRDSRTPWYRALKYRTRGDPVALAKGTEMALIRAEAALRTGDTSAMITELNRVRAHRSMTPLGAVAGVEAAWTLLKRERGAELWLEGRRFWDRRRWFEEGRDNYIANHNDKCFPIAQSEMDANANLRR
jgi:starch-binding outer membrane protein, SusD/RagB family